MDMENEVWYPNRARDPIDLANAFTNNTFSLPEMGNSIRHTMDTSFNYLKDLQRDFMSVIRFNMSEDDVFVDKMNKLSISLDKDFIEATHRKIYRDSEFYNQFLDFETLRANPNIFVFVPLVFIDHKYVNSYKIRCALDGHTDIQFHGLGSEAFFKKDYHCIEVLFLNSPKFSSFVTWKAKLDKGNWKVNPGSYGMSLNQGDTVFFFMKAVGETYGTNIFTATVSTAHKLILDKTDDNLYDYIYNHDEVEITVFSPRFIYEIPGYKALHTKIDTGSLVALVLIEDENGETYMTPIPPQNLFIIKRNRETGELTYENNRTVNLRYPNFYEIESNDLDAALYEYKVYYFYKYDNLFLQYQNKMKFIYRMLENKSGLELEEAMLSYLYNHNPAVEDVAGTNIASETPEFIEMLLEFFYYTDAIFKYDHEDFFQTNRPYDFDYKIKKMGEFIAKDPDCLSDYGQSVATPFISYGLNLKKIDLDDRIRWDTRPEATIQSEIFDFTEPHYVFALRNERFEELNLRIFINGELCTDMLAFHSNKKDFEYIYIPTRLIVNNDTVIEVEQFETYTWHQEHVFEHVRDAVVYEFPAKEFIAPTLYDLYVTCDGQRVDRRNFKLYALIDTSEYEVSDEIVEIGPNEFLLDDGGEIYNDPETGETYVELNSERIDGSDHIPTMELVGWTYEELAERSRRYPIKHMLLNKLRIVLCDDNYVGKHIQFNINKKPYLQHVKVTGNGIPRIRYMNGSIMWQGAHTFVRIFLNGRLVNPNFKITQDENGDVYYIPQMMMETGDIISIDITPYCYDLEYELDEIPQDYIVSFKGGLSKPFDLHYYDIYLNGRKLNSTNIQVLTPDKIKIFNVHSRHNLKIYRRDRDTEYNRLPENVTTPLDIALESEKFTLDEKEMIINDIISYYHPDLVIQPGDNTEPEYGQGEDMPVEAFSKLLFFMTEISAYGMYRPNTKVSEFERIMAEYPEVMEEYGARDEFGQIKNKMIIRPNIHATDATRVLMVGREA